VSDLVIFRASMRLVFPSGRYGQDEPEEAAVHDPVTTTHLDAR
jgi:hypothetical protein